MNKKFDLSLYKKHNEVSINCIASLFEQYGFTIIKHEEAYCSHDFMVEKDGVVMKIEAEQSTVWKVVDGWEGYRYLTVPHRKIKSKADWYCMINNTGSAMLIVPMKLVHQSSTILKDTRYTIGERFFTVEPSYCDFWMKTETWKPCNSVHYIFI